MRVEFCYFVTSDGRRSSHRMQRSDLEAAGLQAWPYGSEWRELPPQTVAPVPAAPDYAPPPRWAAAGPPPPIIRTEQVRLQSAVERMLGVWRAVDEDPPGWDDNGADVQLRGHDGDLQPGRVVIEDFLEGEGSKVPVIEVETDRGLQPVNEFFAWRRIA